MTDATAEKDDLVERRKERIAMAKEICSYRGENPGAVNRQGHEGWEKWEPLAGAVIREAERLFALRGPTAELTTLRAQLASMRDALEANQSWRCFHCDEVFTERAAAQDHFGYHLSCDPACKLNAMQGGLIKIVRKQEEELDRFRAEETASFREFYSLGADHSRALIREEQKGYDRGLADARAALNASPGSAGTWPFEPSRLVDWTYLYALEGHGGWPDSATIIEPLINLARMRAPSQADVEQLRAGATLKQLTKSLQPETPAALSPSHKEGA